MFREIIRLLTFFIIVIFTAISGQSQSLHQSVQNDRKNQLNKLAQSQHNQLEIITSIERRSEPYSLFAVSVAGIGDINLDGYDDIIVGNPYKSAGEAYILFGAAEMDSIPDTILHGEYEGDLFGAVVKSGGDFNGAGDPDFIVAAPDYPNKKGKGRVYVFFGGSVLDSIPDAIFSGELNYGNLGGQIAVGDINNDSCDDILVSAPNFWPVFRVGKVYFFFGGTLLDSIPDWSNESDTLRYYFGERLAIGDVNGDGWKDFLINSTQDIDEPGHDYLVHTEVFFNTSEIDTLSDFILTDSSSGNMQNQILLCDDLNLDGVDDFIIYMIGRVRVYFGKADLDTTGNSYLLPWPRAAINRIAVAGDVNGDGWPDVLAGFYHSFFQTASCGLYLGSECIDATVDWTAAGAGISLDGAGDVNGDGCDDIIVGMYSSPFTSVAWGAAWILAGNADLKDIRTNVNNIEPLESPDKYTLFQNYPNLFNQQTRIRYCPSSKFERQVSMTIYSINGKEVIKLVDERQTPGEHEVSWDGRDQYGKEVSSGVYIARLAIGQCYLINKLILIR